MSKYDELVNEWMNKICSYDSAPYGYHIPDYMAGGLARWIAGGVMPGGFLSAVLRGDLFGALGKADENNLRMLPAYGYFLYNKAPMMCYGSPEKVKAWAASNGLAGSDEG